MHNNKIVLQNSGHTVVAKAEQRHDCFICDHCGKTVLDAGDDVFQLQAQEENREALHIDFCGGYGSAFGDGNRVECVFDKVVCTP